MKFMGQQQMLIKIYFVLKSVSFFSGWVFAIALWIRFDIFLGFGSTTVDDPTPAGFFFNTSLHFKSCFARLSRSNLLFTAGAVFGSLTCKCEIFSLESTCIKRILFNLTLNLLHAFLLEQDLSLADVSLLSKLQHVSEQPHMDWDVT